MILEWKCYIDCKWILKKFADAFESIVRSVAVIDFEDELMKFSIIKVFEKKEGESCVKLPENPPVAY